MVAVQTLKMCVDSVFMHGFERIPMLAYFTTGVSRLKK